MTGERAERFVVLSLRLMAVGFAITGFFFIAWPDGTLARLTELGGHLGFHTPAPKTEERLWLSLGFAYMVVITFLAWIASTDVVRYRPMILALAAGKAASSITSLIFFAEDDVFASLLNGLVDGFLSRMPARTVQVVRLALRTIEFLPFPWRFSRMSVEARSQYMARMESSQFSLYRDLLLLAKLLAMVGWARDERVRNAVGVESR